MRALARRGMHPVAIARNPEKAHDLLDAGALVRVADLSDPSSLTRALEGLDGLICSAGLVSLGGQPVDRVMDVNVQGAAHQVEAAATVGVSRVVMMSSVEAYAPRADHTYDEDSALWPTGRRVHRWNVYGQSKAMGERRAREVAQRRGLSLTTLRPGGIHGPFDTGTLTFWLRRILSWPVTLYPTHTYFTSVYVGDLADAACLCLWNPAAAGKTYNVCGDPDVTFWALKEAWAAAGGPMPRMVIPVPLPIRRTFEIGEIQTDLGWRNRPLVDGFREMFEIERAASACLTAS
jgi:nucleoside-diphosphate-sugar epimerase